MLVPLGRSELGGALVPSGRSELGGALVPLGRYELGGAPVPSGRYPSAHQCLCSCHLSCRQADEC